MLELSPEVEMADTQGYRIKARKESASVYAELSCNKPVVGVDLPNAGIVRLLIRLAKLNWWGFRSPTLIRKHESPLNL